MKHKQFLREVAKFLSGLVLGDFLAGWWMKSMAVGSFSIFGMVFTQQMVLAVMFFDAVLFILLVHYGWKANIMSPSTQEKGVFKIIGIVFGVVAAAHLLRIAFGTTVDIGGFFLPLWLSWVGFVAATYLSYASFHFALSKSK